MPPNLERHMQLHRDSIPISGVYDCSEPIEFPNVPSYFDPHFQCSDVGMKNQLSII